MSPETETLKPIDQDRCALCKRNLENHETVRGEFDGPRWLGWVDVPACPAYETAIDQRAREKERAA